MNLNLEDIARLAGVSRSTVSRVINHHPNVSARTREKVWQVIRERNFQPNQVARMLVTQRAHIIGIVVSQTATLFFNDPSSYFPTIIQGISDVTNAQNYGSLLWLGDGGAGSVDSFYQRIIHNRLMDGLILVSASSSHQLVLRLLETNIPFVTIERPLEFGDRVTYVGIDNREAAKMAVRHLIQQGRRRIGMITGPADNTDSKDRVIGYREAMQEAGLADCSDWIFVGEFTSEAGYTGAEALLVHKLDAIFAASDQIALGAMQTLRRAGLRVPDDVAVVGFDNLPAASTSVPALTTVQHPIREKGAYATRLLLDLIEGVIEEPQHILLPTHLVVRQSCGAARVETSDPVQ